MPGNVGRATKAGTAVNRRGSTASGRPHRTACPFVLRPVGPPRYTVRMPFEIGQHVIRRARTGVVRGVIRHGSVTNYCVRTGVGMQHCDR